MKTIDPDFGPDGSNFRHTPRARMLGLSSLGKRTWLFYAVGFVYLTFVGGATLYLLCTDYWFLTTFWMEAALGGLLILFVMHAIEIVAKAWQLPAGSSRRALRQFLSTIRAYPFRFTIRSLMLLIALIAPCFAFLPLPLSWILSLGIVVIFLLRPKTVIEGLVILLIALVLGGLFMPPVTSNCTRGFRGTCTAVPHTSDLFPAAAFAPDVGPPAPTGRFDPRVCCVTLDVRLRRGDATGVLRER